MKSAFGSIYSPNITSDAKTGIGSWSKADFERALRKGTRKDGAYLYPAMPYGSYTKTVSDMEAVWNYIHSIAAVSNVPPKNTLPFPLSVRSGMPISHSASLKRCSIEEPRPRLKPSEDSSSKPSVCWPQPWSLCR